MVRFHLVFSRAFVVVWTFRSRSAEAAARGIEGVTDVDAVAGSVARNSSLRPRRRTSAAEPFGAGGVGKDDRRPHWTAASAALRRALQKGFPHEQDDLDAAPGGGCKNVGEKCQKANQCCGGMCEWQGSEKRCASSTTTTTTTTSADQCAIANPCLNGGTCTTIDGNFDCVCPVGFEGQFCETNTGATTTTSTTTTTATTTTTTTTTTTMTTSTTTTTTTTTTSMSAITTQNTGQLCSADSDCLSNDCRNNACYQGPECVALKHSPGPFDEGVANLVFVPDKFTSESDWAAKVAEYFQSVKSYVMFGDDNDLYNAFYMSSVDASMNCATGCNGIDRLLCCDVSKAHAAVAEKCGIPPGPTLQTIILHNDTVYAGAGYGSSNVATSTIHSSGNKIAVHELGHSMFDLCDEYSTGRGDASKPNCDNAGCSKWSDLVDSHNVGCYPSMCKDNAYYASEPNGSFMKYLSKPVGAVNERLCCCTYMMVSGGSWPPFCNQYDVPSGKLESFCGLNHQGYSVSHPSGVDGANVVVDGIMSGYAYVEEPTMFLFGLVHRDEAQNEYSFVESFPERSGAYPTRQVKGDYIDLEEARAERVVDVVRVWIRREPAVGVDDSATAASSSCQDTELFLNGRDEVFPPPPQSEEDEIMEASLALKLGGENKEWAPITVLSPELEIVVEKVKGCKIFDVEVNVLTMIYAES